MTGPRLQPSVPGDWADLAECARVGADMSLSKPLEKNLRRPAVVARKAVCERCQVLAECRAWALTSPDPAYGHIAGGLHPWERVQIRRRGRR